MLSEIQNGYTTTVDPQPATGHFLSINTVAVTPLSGTFSVIQLFIVAHPGTVGSIQLASADPFTFPLINPNLLDSPFDQALMIESVRTARRFVQTKPWQGFIVSPIGRLGAAQTDAEILNELRDLVVTVWHPTSTARMSPHNATWGVVDPQLRVKGASGLRVVDASVMVRAVACCFLSPLTMSYSLSCLPLTQPALSISSLSVQLTWSSKPGSNLPFDYLMF